MAHALLAVNPFDVLLRLHQNGTKIDARFSLWLRSFRDPPIRTVRSLIENCPRVDWLLWFLEQCAHLDMLSASLVVNAGLEVKHHIDLIAAGKTYSARRNSEMPHTEGLRVLRDFLNRTIYKGD